MSVEYPTGKDPPKYLNFREKTHTNFWSQNGNYNIEKEKGADDLNIMYISEKPATGESIEVTFNAYHAYLDDDTDELTVPEEHLELIILYVRWACFQELSIQESANPDPTIKMSSSLELNATRAERAYRRALIAYQETTSRTATAHWEMDRFRRIY